jgi:hypothetical protein
MAEVIATLGRVGLPAPVAELAARDWDAVVGGGGHNGLLRRIATQEDR